MRILNLASAVFILGASVPVCACSPPPPMAMDENSVPYFNEYAYAFIGTVVGRSQNEWKDPALEVKVLDSWTAKQKVGEILKVTVQPWSGCGLAKERGSFDPSKYAIGTRLRVVAFSLVIPTWDARTSLTVLGVAP